MLDRTKGGAKNLKVGGQCIGMWGVSTVRTLAFKKRWGVYDPSSFYGGAAPG